MKNTATLFLIIILIILTSCSMNDEQQGYFPSKGEQLVNSLSAKAAKNIKQKYHLRPSGVGVAMPGGPIQEVTLCFDTKNSYTKEELRELLIKSSNELLREISENLEIQDFLKTKPFNIENIEIVIFNHDVNGYGLKDPQISVASISQGKLNYLTKDPKDTFKYKNEYEESYEEALKALSVSSES